MTDQEKENVIATFRQAIAKATTKHRREHINHPSGEDYALCWADALKQEHQHLLVPRKPGRPAKGVKRPASTSKPGLAAPTAKVN